MPVEKGLTYEMFTSRGYKFTDVATITDGELNGYADAGAATPTPSTTKLVKGSTPAVYLVENGKKTLLDYQTFVNRGFKFSDVATIADTELNSYPGTVASAQDPKPAATPPANMTYFTNKKTGEFWVYMNGGKHLISPFVAKQKKMTPDVAYEDDYVQSLATSTPIIPRDGTILKGTKPDVYVITGGVARPLTAVAFKARGITSAQIVVLPQPEVDGYVKGPVLNN